MEDAPLPWQVEKQVIEVPTIGTEVGVIGSCVPEWANGVIKYLDKGKLPEDKEEARRIRRSAARFMRIDEILYKRGFTTLLIRCISPQKAQYVLTEIHEGICGNHSGVKVLPRKAVRAGY